MISSGALTTVLDSLASSKLIFDAAQGTTGAQANTVAKAAENDLDTLSAINDIDVQADLSPAFRIRATAVRAGSLYRTLGGWNLWWALDKHTGGLNGFLNTNNVRVSPALKDMGFPLSAEQILPPSVDPMGTYAVSGADSGTYTYVASIDTSLYGKAWVQLVTTATIGASPITATVIGLQWDQTTVVSQSAVIGAGSSSGSTVNVGTLGLSADHYYRVTSVSITGGTSGDAFKIISRVERTIPATA